ncbi:glycosyltransferase family 39 protein [Oscillatoria sp. CS-180]|uniref:ArnT family glycosyltransferase n=1 Tax=Oscillatoria sp. CS-180 TaxID=3021720 RepID=UPI00232BB60E|nr:glycosyltransferase family 39 protein [Oscillatoria sp. CS-180]MDB9529203.1 glycosyltransferase family 39 protein [Oscillatoria sp. CS-180]
MNSSVLRQYWSVLLLLIGLRLIFWLGAFPNPDEAYYWLWGQHLDWSYFDHPPFHAWVQGLFAAALGRSRFVLRLPTLISTGLLFGLYWVICHRLCERQARNAFWLTVLLFLTSPLFFLFSAMAWHDHWLIWFGTASSYCLIRFLSSDRSTSYPWLYAAGVLIGLAGLCKYVALFLGLGFLVAIASHPRWRLLFSTVHLYGAIVLALLVLTPVFWWNIQNEFYSFQFYLGRSVQSEASVINWLGPIGFLLLSALILGPIHVWALLASTRRGFTKPFGIAYQRVALIVLGTSTVLLALLSLRAPVLYYWNILAYPLSFPLMAVVFLNLHHLAKLRHPRVLKSTLALGTLAAVVLVTHYTVLPLSALVSETGDDDTRMLYGWNTVASAIEREIAAFSEQPLLLTTDYRSASALAYVLNDPSVIALSGRIDQFDFWYDSAALNNQSGILLGDRWHPICPAHLALFERTDPPISVAVQRWGVFIKTYDLVKGYDFKSTATVPHPLSPDYPLSFTSDGETCS